MNKGVVPNLIAQDLRGWISRPVSWAWMAVAVVVLCATEAGLLAHGTPSSLFRSVLGGPHVVEQHGQLGEGPDWTWLTINVLFVIETLGASDNEAAWRRLILVRGVSRTQWAGARLATLMVGAAIFLVVLLLVLELTVVMGWQTGPVISAAAWWDVGLWALGLVSLGWFGAALTLITNQSWAPWVVTMALLGVGRYGGPLSPYAPFAQWIYDLHGLPGTLGVEGGTLYVAAWTVLCGVVTVVVARGRPFGEVGST